MRKKIIATMITALTLAGCQQHGASNDAATPAADSNSAPTSATSTEQATTTSVTTEAVPTTNPAPGSDVSTSAPETSSDDNNMQAAPQLEDPAAANGQAPSDSMAPAMGDDANGAMQPQDAMSGATPPAPPAGNDANGAMQPQDAMSGATPPAAMSGETPPAAISGATPPAAMSGETPPIETTTTPAQ